MGLVHVSPVPCSRSCCCACAFLLGIAEGLPLSLWLSFIAEGLPLAPVSLGYISLTAAGACVNRVSPWAHYPHSLRGTAHRGRSRREWLEYAKNRKRNKKDIKLSFLC